MKRGFTLMELLVSLVVLGAVGAIAIPNYYNSLEKARQNEAVINLKAIHTAEKLFRLKHPVYWGPGATTLDAINTNLNLDLSASDYKDGISVEGGRTYKAYFRRTGGQKTAMIDQTGVVQWFDASPTGGGTGGTGTTGIL